MEVLHITPYYCDYCVPPRDIELIDSNIGWNIVLSTLASRRVLWVGDGTKSVIIRIVNSDSHEWCSTNIFHFPPSKYLQKLSGVLFCLLQHEQ